MHRFLSLKGVLTGFLFCLAWAVYAQTPGFFLDDHAQKTADLPPFKEYEKPAADADVTIHADFHSVITPVGKFLFGNNANPYMTQMVNEPVLLDYIRDLKPNVIRYPGGNLSSVFFWDSPKGVPPADAPGKILNGNGAEIDPSYWYGTNEESWTLSVDNYYEMLAQTGSTGIITVNYGYARYGLSDDPVAAAAHLAAEWVRYDDGRTRFWEIGNESNGNWQAGYRINTATNKDGQPEIVTGALYGRHFKVFADSMRKAAAETGAEIFIGAQLLQEEPASWWGDTDRYWNEGVLAETGNLLDYYIIHSYYTNYAENSGAATILNSASQVTQKMMQFVTGEVDRAGLVQKPVALTEWNIFAEGSKQQVSYINGMHAAIVLGELIKNKYGMASRWDLANGWSGGNDHGMFSQGDQPGVPKWSPRASFYYMYFFQRYIGDEMVSASVDGSPDILAYASAFSSGEAGYVVVNKSPTAKNVAIHQANLGTGDRYYFHTLTGGTDNGEFSLKVFVNGTGPSLTAGGPSTYKTIEAKSALVQGGIRFQAPARSVTYLMVDSGDDLVTGMEESSGSEQFIYPNPSSRNFIFDPASGGETIELVTLQGRVVFRQTVQRPGKIEVRSDVPAGMYMARSTGRNGERHQKIIINE